MSSKEAERRKESKYILTGFVILTLFTLIYKVLYINIIIIITIIL